MEENKRRSADREGGQGVFLWRIVDGYDKMIIV